MSVNKCLWCQDWMNFDKWIGYQDAYADGPGVEFILLVYIWKRETMERADKKKKERLTEASVLGKGLRVRTGGTTLRYDAERVLAVVT